MVLEYLRVPTAGARTTLPAVEPIEDAMKELPLEDAEASLSALVDRAVAGESTIILRKGRKAAVLVSFEAWQRLSAVPSFADLLLAFPGEPGDIPARARKPARALRNA